jgi:hypothetical protein
LRALALACHKSERRLGRGVLLRGCGPGEGPSSVDAINTFGVSAGHFASFGVVSRS